MFAKSNVNQKACSASGPDVCTSGSAACCPQNDVVYESLQSTLSNSKLDSTIHWNFDTIVVNAKGVPVAHVQGGAPLDDAIRAASSSVEIPPSHCSLGDAQMCMLYVGGNYLNWCSSLHYVEAAVAAVLGCCVFMCFRKKCAKARETDYILLA